MTRMQARAAYETYIQMKVLSDYNFFVQKFRTLKL